MSRNVTHDEPDEGPIVAPAPPASAEPLGAEAESEPGARSNRGPTPLSVTSRRLTPGQVVAVTRERLFWNRRAVSWDVEGSTGLTKVVEALLEDCLCAPETEAVDLGCGSGQVTIPLARRCGHVLALDVSAPSIAMLDRKAAAADVGNIQSLAQPIETLELQSGSVDLIVSNYALHHLRDPDKAALMRQCHTWLRPGGQLVIGDMMFGRGSNAGDRAIIATKARGMLSRGPAGWWRLLKNVGKFAFRVWEKPLPAAKWESLVQSAGFTDVAIRHVVAEASVLSARKPHSGEPAAQARLSDA